MRSPGTSRDGSGASNLTALGGGALRLGDPGPPDPLLLAITRITELWLFRR